MKYNTTNLYLPPPSDLYEGFSYFRLMIQSYRKFQFNALTHTLRCFIIQNKVKLLEIFY